MNITSETQPKLRNVGFGGYRTNSYKSTFALNPFRNTNERQKRLSLVDTRRTRANQGLYEYYIGNTTKIGTCWKKCLQLKTELLEFLRKYALSCYRGYRSTTPTRPNTLITAANTAEAIKTRSTGESANGALEDECEDESTGESTNGALHTEWRSGTLKMKLQGRELQQQQNHTRERVRSVQSVLTPHPKQGCSNILPHMYPS